LLESLSVCLLARAVWMAHGSSTHGDNLQPKLPQNSLPCLAALLKAATSAFVKRSAKGPSFSGQSSSCLSQCALRAVTIIVAFRFIATLLISRFLGICFPMMLGAVQLYAKSIYRVYMRWKDRRVARRSARLMAQELSITRRKGTSPMHVLIEATFPGADLRQKSRWVRALEYLASEDVPAREFKRFMRANGGLAGCARLAAEVNRKRRRPGGDWND